jgi:hypothetical protein
MGSVATNQIDVVLVTWPNHPKRMEYLQHVWRTLQEKLTASRHTLRFVCSAESERDPECVWCGEQLVGFCEYWNIPLTWHTGPASLGAGMNAAIKATKSDLAFVHQDDFELLYPLDLSPGAEFLSSHQEASLIRYGYPPPRFEWRLLDYAGGWKRFDLEAHWPYGDEPHLQRRDFTDRHGWYVEGVGHASEGMMLHRLIADNAIILAADKSYYGHCGNVSALPRAKEFSPLRQCRR